MVFFDLLPKPISKTQIKKKYIYTVYIYIFIYTYDITLPVCTCKYTNILEKSKFIVLKLKTLVIDTVLFLPMKSQFYFKLIYFILFCLFNYLFIYLFFFLKYTVRRERKKCYVFRSISERIIIST